MQVKQFNIKNYITDTGAESLQTQALQKAIDDCFQAGGGEIVFPKGEYVLSTVYLKSNVHIRLEKDAVILGSLDFNDYAENEVIDYPIYQDASHTYYYPSMFVAIDCENIAIYGEGKIDMRSVWDEENKRKIVHRGAKCIAFKNCKNVRVSGLEINHVTDLGVHFAGCENVDVFGLKMRVYIDGISLDNSKNARVHDCQVEAGDDAIVFKSSYTLNRLDVCRDVRVWDCKLKSRCNAIKFGTETNGGFENIHIENIDVYETRMCGIAIESVDGAVIDGITIKNVIMRNVNTPLFIHLGKRMRGPAGREIGEIKNVLIENVVASGPYEPYEVVAWNYASYIRNDFYQKPWVFGRAESFDDTNDGNTAESDWQMTSNVCGLEGRPLKNIVLRNIHLSLDGGVQSFNKDVPEEAQDYPEVYVYGRILPAKGIYFRYIDGLTVENVTVETNRPDVRKACVFEKVNALVYK
ncbi:MAG: hypothetical protein J6A63_01875 [Clostridia bacterium]|nr:hypothetical protein [Clostridia bacterium]